MRYLILAVSTYGVIIIINILLTGVIRSRGITGSAFSDIIVCSLLITLFRHFFLENPRPIHIFMLGILLIILIADLSRFAWVGFMLSLTYGMIITTKFEKGKFIKRKMKLVFMVFAAIVALMYISGLYDIILTRFSDVSFSILQSEGEKEVIGNSLDTRGLIWITALSAFLSNPLTGVGYFMFHKVSYDYNVLPDAIYMEYVYGLDAHSTLINFLCETGLIGFTAILLLFLAVFILSYKSIRISKLPADVARSLILNILVFFIVTTCVYSGAYTFGYNGYFLYFVFALVVANFSLLKMKSRNKSVEPNVTTNI